MKIPYAALLVLTLPVTLAAQGSSNPPTDPLTTVFRQPMLTWQANLAQAFDSIPESKYGYKPTPAQLTVGYIAQHLASDNYLFCDAFGTAKGTRPAADTTTADSVKATWPKDTLTAQLKASFAFCEQALAQLDDAKLAEPVTMSFRGNTRTVARANMVLGHALDMADHYSQIANYMRLNGMLPPSAQPRPRM